MSDAAPLGPTHPWYAWLGTLAPATARRFRIPDAGLATVFAAAGAEIVVDGAEVEVAAFDELEGQAPFVIVPIHSRLIRTRWRSVRMGRRLARFATVQLTSTRTLRRLRSLGYSSFGFVPWERSKTVPLLLPGTRGEGHPSRLVHRFPVNAVVLAGRAAHAPNAFEAAVDDARTAWGQSLDLELPFLGVSGVVVALGKDVVLRVGFGPARSELDAQRAALDDLRAANPPSVVAEVVPWVLAHGQSGLAAWTLERRLPGLTGRVLTGELHNACLDFLVALFGRSTGRAGEGAVRAHAEVAARAMQSAHGSRRLLKLAQRLDEELRDLRRGFGHGDFWAGNVLTVDERISGVVDWAAARPGRLPGLDLMHLDVSAFRERAGADLGEAVAVHLLPWARAGGDMRFREYRTRVGIELDAHRLTSLACAYWLEQVSYELRHPEEPRTTASERSWTEKNVDQVLVALPESFSGE